MSLFKVRTWWTAQCTDMEENYDIASLICARFGLEDNEKDYIVVGSQNGLLSIFYPNPPSFDSNHNFEQFQAEDLLLECQLKAPILAILSGRFSGTFARENTNQLAILHPNNLAIYNLKTVDGVADHGNHSQLQTVVEHTVARTAFSLCKGHFGQVKGREFLCIGHLDGSLTFYEQDGISYECNLPGPRPLPSLVVYVERTDSFLRINSSWHLESFSYQDLSQSVINNSDVDINPVWSVCLGEGVLNIIPVQVREKSTTIMILGERNLLAVNDYGDIEFILKLDFSPKCFAAFSVGYYWEPDVRLMIAIISENSKLFIYQGPNLAWAAQLEDVPVALQRSNLNNLPGGIVTLGPTGHLKVSYLGSEQHVFQIPPLNVEELDFKRAHNELLKLEDEIKQAIDLGDIDVINQMAENDLSLDFSIGSELNECSFPVPEDLTGIPMCSGCLKFKSNTALEEIQIAVSTPEGVRCSLETMKYTEVTRHTVQELPMHFYLAENLHIETSKVELLVSFINKQGVPRVLTKTGYLPMEMLFKSAPPQKTASLKVTLNINTKSIATKLSNFFPEFCSIDNDVQALGLTLLQQQHTSLSGENAAAIVTIVTAKNSKRIRIQSDSMEALPLVLERIVNKVNEVEVKKEDSISRKGRKAKKTHRAGGDGNSKAVIASPSIPIEEILNRIDAHHSLQEEIRKQMAVMDALWNQFKSFQRSLQEKAEGDPKDDLVMLIEKNYDDLVTEGDKLVDLRCAEKGIRSKLSCALAVAKIIISCLAIESKVSNLVTNILTTPAEDFTEMSWEQSMSPAIDMLHHYGPLNRSKISETQMLNADISKDQFEYDRFRRHFQTLFERVCRLAVASDAKKLKDIEAEKSIDFSVEDENEKEKLAGSSKPKTRLEALQDDEEEEEEGDKEVAEVDRRPESDWLNTETNESIDVLASMLLKSNVQIKNKLT